MAETPTFRGGVISTPREAAEHLAEEAKRLAAIADRFGFRDVGDSCHQLRIRAEQQLRGQSYQGSARR